MELSNSINMLLSGLFIFGFICTGLSIPAPNDENIDYNIQGDDDYPSYSDDDEPGISEKVTPGIKLMDQPIFERSDYSIHTKVGEDANLICPVKNLGDNNIVLWYRGEDLVIQHMKPTNNKVNPRIGSAANHTLVIHNSTIEDTGNYTCVVLPAYLNMTLHVKLDTTSAAISISVSIFLPIISVVLLLTSSSVSKFLRI